MGRKQGDKAQPDEIYKFFRIREGGSSNASKAAGEGGGPTDKAQCLFCDKEFSCQKGRLLIHLGRIKGATGAKPCLGPSRAAKDNADLTEDAWGRKMDSFRAVSDRMRTRFDEENALKRKKAEDAILDAQTDGCNLGVAPKKTKHKQATLNVERRSIQMEADLELTKAFAACGMAPNVLDNPIMKRALRKVALCGASYDVPGRKQVSGNLLDAAYQSIKSEMTETAGDLGRTYGNTLVSDGATAIDRTPVLNMLGVTAGLVQFLKAKDCRGHIKNAEYIADFTVDAILEQETPFATVQVLMDNATRSSWPLIEKNCPWVSCAPCTPHVCDLELEDYYKAFEWVRDVVELTKKLRKFIYNHQACLAAFQALADSMLSLPGATRFATCGILLLSAVKNRSGLEQLFLDVAIKEFVDRNKTTKNEAGETLLDRFTELKAQVSNDKYWQTVQGAVDLFAPVTRLLRLTDSDTPCASKVYYNQYVIQEQLGKLELPFMDKDSGKACRAKAVDIHLARWAYGFSPVQATGYLLDPEYWRMHEHIIGEVNDGFMTMVEKTYPLPTEPPELCSHAERVAYLEEYDAQCAHREEAEQQLQSYLKQEGVFGRATTQANAKKMAAAEWWHQYGGHVPDLQLVAVRCLAQIAGAGGAERGRKEMNFIKSKVRNRLTILMTEKLIYTRHNLMQLDRRKRMSFREEPLAWYLWDEEHDDSIEVGLDDAWDDVWLEAAKEAEQKYEVAKEALIAQAAGSAAKIAVAAARHTPPSIEEVDSSSLPREQPEEAEALVTSRLGRRIRRPGNLADFAM